MRNLLALIGLLVVGFGGLGWYMGWYKLSVARNTDGNIQIKTDVDTHKVSSDSSEALKNLGSAIGNHVEKAAQDSKGTSPTGAPGGTPGPVSSPQSSAFNPLATNTPNTPNTTPTQGGIPLFAPK